MNDPFFFDRERPEGLVSQSENAQDTASDEEQPAAEDPLPLGLYSEHQKTTDEQHARQQIMSNAGGTIPADRQCRDHKWTGNEMLESCDILAAKILCTLCSIPDSIWKS